MNLELIAAIGFVVFVFFLIQISKMRSLSHSDSAENCGKAVPAYISERSEKKQSIIAEHFVEEKYINDDTLN